MSEDAKHFEIKVIFLQHIALPACIVSNLKLSNCLSPLLIRKANFTVALDTRGFNGHSSVSDVIWSGVPVVSQIANGINIMNATLDI
jgi:hypothetical protein